MGNGKTKQRGVFNPDDGKVITHDDVTEGPGLREDGHIWDCGNGGDDPDDCSSECAREQRAWWARYEVLKQDAKTAHRELAGHPSRGVEGELQPLKSSRRKA